MAPRQSVLDYLFQWITLFGSVASSQIEEGMTPRLLKQIYFWTPYLTRGLRTAVCMAARQFVSWLLTSACLLSVAITQGGAIQLANNGTDGVQGLQTLTMTNAAATQPGTTILQYAQTTDGQQILVPSNQVVVQGELISDVQQIHSKYPVSMKLILPWIIMPVSDSWSRTERAEIGRW